MSKKHLIWIFFAIFLLLTAAGCVPECTEGEMDTSYLSSLDPHGGVIVSSLSPTLDWSWSPTTCNPHHFVVSITSADTGHVEVQNVNGSSRDTTPSSLLEAGAKYNWSIYGTTSGDYTGYTREADFYTGPLCTNVTPVAPTLDFPADGEFVTPKSTYMGLKLQWTYSEFCLPHSYVYEFASDPDFNNILFSGETGDYKQEMYQVFEDCTTVYWHIAAKNGNNQGPFSETRSFNHIIHPKCWMNHYPSDDVALIRGKVYIDQCSQTFQVLSGGASAYGCIDHSFGIVGDDYMNWNEDSQYGYEPGMSNVVVDLGIGPCPSTGLDQTVTGANGWFAFTVLTPGDYCLSVRKDQTGYVKGTDYNMMNGIWSNPLTKALTAEYDLSLSDGWHHLIYNFGWDEYDAFVKPFFFEKIWCRRTPFHWCDPWILYDIGDSAVMLARNEKGTWIKSSVQGEVCYFYNSIQTEEEMVPYSLGMPKDEYLKRFNELEVFEAPPPCPTPTPTPRPKPVEPDDPCAGKGERGCIADPACKWVPSSVGPGYCAKK